MNYSASITADLDASLLRSFKPENKEGSRSSYTVSQKDDKIIFTIRASDAVSLRASLNSITKLLIISEKMGNI